MEVFHRGLDGQLTVRSVQTWGGGNVVVGYRLTTDRSLYRLVTWCLCIYMYIHIYIYIMCICRLHNATVIRILPWDMVGCRFVRP